MWPTFSVAEVDANGAPLGSVDIVSVGKETWVGDRYLGYLKLKDSLIPGRWHNHDAGWRFAPDEPATFLPGHNYSVLDGYWGERALIATDASLTWSTDAWTDINDHDHCSICWATISTIAESNYYQSSANDRVCSACYRNYVSQRDISFVPVA